MRESAVTDLGQDSTIHVDSELPPIVETETSLSKSQLLALLEKLKQTPQFSGPESQESISRAVQNIEGGLVTNLDIYGSFIVSSEEAGDDLVDDVSIRLNITSNSSATAGSKDTYVIYFDFKSEGMETSRRENRDRQFDKYGDQLNIFRKKFLALLN